MPIDLTMLEMAVEKSLYPEETKMLLHSVCLFNPRLRGSSVAEVLDIFYDIDLYFEEFDRACKQYGLKYFRLAPQLHDPYDADNLANLALLASCLIYRSVPTMNKPLAIAWGGYRQLRKGGVIR